MNGETSLKMTEIGRVGSPFPGCLSDTQTNKNLRMSNAGILIILIAHENNTVLFHLYIR